MKNFILQHSISKSCINEMKRAVNAELTTLHLKPGSHCPPTIIITECIEPVLNALRKELISHVAVYFSTNGGSADKKPEDLG